MANERPKANPNDYLSHLCNEYVLMRLINDATNTLPGGPRIDTRTARNISKYASFQLGLAKHPSSLLVGVNSRQVAELYFSEMNAGARNMHNNDLRVMRQYVGKDAFMAEFGEGPDENGNFKPNDKFFEKVGRYIAEFDGSVHNGVVPVSPYAPVLMDKDVFMSSGVKPLYAKREDVRCIGEFDPFKHEDPMDQMWRREKAERVRGDKAHVLYKTSAMGKDDAIEQYRLVTNMDLLGLSRLRPFLTTDEYEGISNSVRLPNYDIPATLCTSDGKYKTMTWDVGSKAIRMLNYLEQSGETYEIKPGRDAGSIVVKFDDKDEFTLVSLQQPHMSCGRYYSDGVVTTMQVLKEAYPDVQTDDRDSKGRGKDKDKDKNKDRAQKPVKVGDNWADYTYYMDGGVRKAGARPEESLNFLKYCRGEPVVITAHGGKKPIEAYDMDQLDVYSDEFWAHRGDQTFSIKPKTGGPFIAGHVENKRKYGNNTAIAPTNFSANALRVHLGTFSGPDGKAFPNSDAGKKDSKGIARLSMPLVARMHYEGRTKNVTAFRGKLGAYNFTEAAVGSARENFQKAINMDMLLAQARLYHSYDEQRAVEEREAEIAASRGEDYFGTVPEVTFEPSIDSDIAALQASYWDILTGSEDILMRPEYDRDQYESVDDTLTGGSLEEMSYHGTPEEKVRQHMQDMTDRFIGRFKDEESCDVVYDVDEGGSSYVKEIRIDGPQFNPVNVARYMTSKYGEFRNKDDLLNALRVMDFQAEHVLGVGEDSMVDYFAERLVKFDPDSAVSMETLGKQDPFMQRMCDTIYDSVSQSGCAIRKSDIRIDHRGIVHYTAARPYDGKAVGDASADPTKYKAIEGELGPILAPDEKGLVKAEKYYFVPGYIGNIRPNQPGEDLPWEERVVLRGYEQVLRDSIRRRVRSDLIGYATDKNADSISVGEPMSLNSALRQLYDRRYELDFVTRTAEDGMSAELRDAIIRTDASRVRFPNDFLEGANRVNLFQRQENDRLEPMVVNDRDPSSLTGCRNLALLESPGDGIFDPSFTGNGSAQGIRYLAIGSKVRPDGTIERAPLTYVTDPETGKIKVDLSKLPRCPIIKYLQDTGRAPDYDAADRTNMEGNGLLHSLREATGVKFAQVNVGGWTFEDGIVVSKEFAEKHPVRAHESGEMRPLDFGDKMTEHGNKGVIAMVVDKNMSDEEAREKGILKLVQFFRKNPDLDMVQSPYSGVSRFNAGTFAEAHARGAEDLTMPDGTVVKGGKGTINVTILEQTGDSKTHNDANRTYGPQAFWAMLSANCPAIITDSYASNTKSIAALREYLITIGMDLTPDGQMRIGYMPHEGEERNLFEMSVANFRAPAGKKVEDIRDRMRQGYQEDSTVDAYLEEIADKGGFLEVPFQLDFPRFHVSKKDQAKGVRVTGSELGSLEEIPWEERSEESKKAWPGKTYKLPIMSSYLRSGMDYGDGDPISHDYTNRYKAIIKAACKIQSAYWQVAYTRRVEDIRSVPDDAVKKFGVGRPDGPVEDMVKAVSRIRPVSKSDGTPWPSVLDEKNKKQTFADIVNKCKASAQREFNQITSDVVTRRMEEKRNMFRTGVMSNKQAKSATAIWSPDPRLSVTEIGMNPDMASALGLREGDYALIHRDPVLQESGMRYMKVKLDENLVGVSVNPAGVPKGMDGDFDGDTVGAHRPKLKIARAEAIGKLSVRNNLLDPSSKGDNGDLKLFIAGGQDIAAGIAADPSLKTRYDQIERWVNQFERDGAAKRISSEQLGACRDAAVKQIDRFVHDAFDAGFGRNVISYESPEAHFQSMIAYTKDGCKGSTGKVVDYGHFAGYELEWEDTSGKNPEGLVAVHENKDMIYSQKHRDENCGMLAAKNFQQQYTGFAGSFSIRAMTALLSICPNEASRLSKLATQGVLQVKHDRVMADTFENILSGPARNLWHGYKMRPCEGSVRTVVPTGEFYEDEHGALHERTEVVVTPTDTWEVVKDEQGNPVQATKEEFMDQFMVIYKRDMGLDVNEDLLAVVADAMEAKASDGVGPEMVGRMLDLEESLYDRTAASLQRVAYASDLKGIVETTSRMMLSPDDPRYLPGLFEVPDDQRIKYNFNAMLADDAIMRENVARKAAYKERVADGCTRDQLITEGWTEEQLQDAVAGVFVKGLKPVVKSDCLVGGEPKARPDNGRIISNEARKAIVQQHVQCQRPVAGQASPEIERAASNITAVDGEESKYSFQ